VPETVTVTEPETEIGASQVTVTILTRVWAGYGLYRLIGFNLYLQKFGKKIKRKGAKARRRKESDVGNFASLRLVRLYNELQDLQDRKRHDMQDKEAFNLLLNGLCSLIRSKTLSSVISVFTGQRTRTHRTYRTHGTRTMILPVSYVSCTSYVSLSFVLLWQSWVNIVVHLPNKKR
jgi:hypothetical protein